MKNCFNVWRKRDTKHYRNKDKINISTVKGNKNNISQNSNSQVKYKQIRQYRRINQCKLKRIKNNQ